MSEPTNFNYAPFDALLAPDGPVILVGQQFLRPAAIANDEIVFPPSYANPSERKDDPPVYNIDNLDPADPSKNVCVLDSIPSQANRMEPLFGSPEYSTLVPQYSIQFVNDSPPVSILCIGHRLADAAFRGTALRNQIVHAFKEYAKGDAVPMALRVPQIMTTSFPEIMATFEAVIFGSVSSQWPGAIGLPAARKKEDDHYVGSRTNLDPSGSGTYVGRDRRHGRGGEALGTADSEGTADHKSRVCTHAQVATDWPTEPG